MTHHTWACLVVGALGLVACGGGSDDNASASPSVAVSTVGAALLPPTEEATLDASLQLDSSADTLSADLLPPT